LKRESTLQFPSKDHKIPFKSDFVAFTRPDMVFIQASFNIKVPYEKSNKKLVSNYLTNYFIIIKIRGVYSDNISF